MTKKILIGLFVLLIAAVSIVAFNFYKNVKQPVSNSSIIAVPQNAAFILQENNFSALYQKIANTNIIWEELISNTETGQKVNTQIHYMDSLLSTSFEPITKQQPILTSAHLSGANDFDFIFYINLPYDISEEELVQKIKNTTRKNVSSRVYDAVNIFTIPIAEKSKIAFTFYKNIFAFSYSTVLIEDVIRQLNADKSLLDNLNFSTILSTSGQAEDGNLYINNAHFPKIIDQFLSPEAKKYNANFEHYANWTELDITTKPNALMLNGFTLATDSNQLFLSLFKNQKPQQIELTKVAPANTALLYYYGLSDTKAFFENRKSQLKTQNLFFNYQQFLDEQSQQFSIDLEEEFLGNIGNELALIITEPLTDDIDGNQFVVFKANDVEKTKANLNNIAQKQGMEVPEDPLLFNDFEIKNIALKDVFDKLLGKPFINMDNSYYTFITDYVVFAKTESALKAYLTDFSNRKTLAENKNYQAYSENLSSDANYFVYCNIARSVNLFNRYSAEKYIPLFDDKLETFRKFEAISIQVNTEKNNLYYNNIYLKYNPVYKQDTRSLWEIELDSTVSQKPQLVVNHRTDMKEIFVQDDGYKIYLISNTGKILWTKQLQDKIIGEVHQIDVYKNNKLQLLFNTKNKIYLIDRNGNNVEKFPIKLNHEATNGITPLDYSNNRNYRLLIGCNDGMVYNYNTQGNLVEGWEYQATESVANGNIWHTAFAGKDYIVIPQQNGQVKIIQRNGKDRLKLNNKLPATNRPIYFKASRDLNKTYLSTIDSNGIIHRISLADKLSAVQLSDEENGSKYAPYKSNYGLIYNGIFNFFDEEKTNLITIELTENIQNYPMFFSFPENKIAIGLISNRNIYLYTEDGVLFDGFPLIGATPFSIADINKDKTLNLVVGDGNKIYTYNLK